MLVFHNLESGRRNFSDFWGSPLSGRPATNLDLKRKTGDWKDFQDEKKLIAAGVILRRHQNQPRTRFRRPHL